MTENREHTKKNLVITGSSGLIGSHLTDALVGDFHVIGLDLHPHQSVPEDFEWIQCDLTDDDSVEQAIRRIRQDHGDHLASVIHLAAYYDFSGKPSPLYEKLTVEGTRRLVRALETLRVDQLIFSSSLLVMKPADEEGHPLTEESPTRAEWDYPSSKLRAEHVLKTEHGSIPVVVLRIAGVYDDQCHSLPISQQIRRIYEKDFESIVFPGDADHGQPFIHIDDLVTCVRAAIERRDVLDPYEMFLIAEPDVMSYQELQSRLGKLIYGHEWPTIRIPKPVAKAGAWVKTKLSDEEQFIRPWMIDLADDDYSVAITRAQSRLGWRPQHRLRDSLEGFVTSLKRDPLKWFKSNGLPPPAQLEHAETAQTK